MSLNPIYAEWVWDWYVLNKAYDSMIGLNPYTLADMRSLAASWEVETWDASKLGLGTCTKITFHMRHDLYWSDGVPVTSSDVKFTWGSYAVTDSLSNLLYKRSLPLPYWGGQVEDILSIATPDPWTVIVYLDVYAYFGLHSMSGFNIVLPEHIWKPIAQSGDVLSAWNQPNVCSGPWIITSTADPATLGYIILKKNPLHYQLLDNYTPCPIDIWTIQTSNATTQLGNTHYIYPKAGETAVTLNVIVKMHTSYAYENGPYQENVYKYTKFDVSKTVSLWKWNSTKTGSKPSIVGDYYKIADLGADTVDVIRCTDHVENFIIPNLTPGWYFVKVEVTITSLWISADGATWTEVPAANNPFYGASKVYREFATVTSRYDIGGAFWKKVGTKDYQSISDLNVNLKDTFACAIAFGSQPGFANWNPACDVNGDNKVDLKDYFAIALNFGWKG
jgi:hypothetical protein